MRLDSGYILTEVSGEYMLVPDVEKTGNSTNTLTGLSETGAFLCTCLMAGCSCEELVRAVMEEFDAEEDAVREDIGEFIEELRRKGVLIEDDGTGTD